LRENDQGQVLARLLSYQRSLSRPEIPLLISNNKFVPALVVVAFIINGPGRIEAVPSAL